jgi:hypothetical protein
MSGENWEKIKDDRKWGNIDWRFLCINLPISLKTRMMMMMMIRS